jgi:serine/threonine-protein kinase
MSVPAALATALQDRYRLDRELGQGGMATVYLAHDLRNNRKVALKVLRPELAAILGAERFLKEIETTANLQHPHILPLFDSGEAGTFLFYVMPYIEGESLRARLDREKQLPIADAVRIATEVASALDYAHRRGILHRDIKPENVLLHDGQAQVADFGIALAMRNAGGARLTETGLSLGTPQYMSPEQATAERELDARTDVYALGAVTYEMLTGEPPFTGTTTQAIIAKLMTETPRPVSVLRKAVPPAVEGAVLIALEKLPADRFASAAEFTAALDGKAGVTAVRATARAATGRNPRLPFMIASGVAVAATALALWGWLRPSVPGPLSLQRIALTSAGRLPADVFATVAVAPDNSAIVFVDTIGGRKKLWIKERAQIRPAPVQGTDGAEGPVFSPNGRWIGFVAGDKLMKVPREGGAPITLADSAGPYPGVNVPAAWLDDGTLVFVHEDYGLARVSEAGGPVVHLATEKEAGGKFFQLSPLPGSRGVLAAADRAGLFVLDLKSGKVRKLMETEALGWFLPPDRLVYFTRAGAFAIPFDPASLTPHGSAVPILGPLHLSRYNLPEAVVSAGGIALYEPGSGEAKRPSRLVWVDRTGQEVALDGEWFTHPVPNGGLALSPDGRILAIDLPDSAPGKGVGIWMKQLPRGPLSRLTFDGDTNFRPAWSPDGQTLLYASNRSGVRDVELWRQRADGSQPAELLVKGTEMIREGLWSPDGKWVIYKTWNPDRRIGSLFAIRPGTDSAPRALTGSKFYERSPTISPNGRWLAFVSDESAREEVYVRPFPDGATGKWQVSTAGGTEPLWSRDGREIFFINTQNQMVAAQVTVGPTFAVKELRTLFPMGHYTGAPDHRNYDVTSDGRRFVMQRETADSSDLSGDLVLVENLATEIRNKLEKRPE